MTALLTSLLLTAVPFEDWTQFNRFEEIGWSRDGTTSL
jgi:hypothetical protein